MKPIRRGAPVAPIRACQRIDRLLWMLRLTRTRGAAQVLIGEGHVRLNGKRVVRSAQQVGPGDIVTMPHGMGVRIVEIVSLPERRCSPVEAQGHYREHGPSAAGDGIESNSQ